MGRKSKFSVVQKLEAVEDVLIRYTSKKAVAKRLGLRGDIHYISY